jgi:hypothetical protein
VKQKSPPLTNIMIPALDKSVSTGQFYLSPVPIAIGMQKVRHTLITHRSFSEGGPCHRDNFPAKEPRLVAGWLSQVTLTAHTRWQL